MRGHQPTTGTGVPSQTPDQGTSGRRSTVPERDSGLARITALEERLARLESRVAQLEQRQIPIYLNRVVSQTPGCNCPPDIVCGNAACPRAMRVTCAVSTKEIEN